MSNMSNMSFCDLIIYIFVALYTYIKYDMAQKSHPCFGLTCNDYDEIFRPVLKTVSETGVFVYVDLM